MKKYTNVKKTFIQQNLQMNCQVLLSSLIGGSGVYAFPEVWKQMLPESSVIQGVYLDNPSDNTDAWMPFEKTDMESSTHAKIREGPS